MLLAQRSEGLKDSVLSDPSSMRRLMIQVVYFWIWVALYLQKISKLKIASWYKIRAEWVTMMRRANNIFICHCSKTSGPSLTQLQDGVHWERTRLFPGGDKSISLCACKQNISWITGWILCMVLISGKYWTSWDPGSGSQYQTSATGSLPGMIFTWPRLGTFVAWSCHHVLLHDITYEEH